MTASTIQPARAGAAEQPQQSAARTAGLVYLISFALIAYVNFGIHGSLYSGDPNLGHLDAARTAHNILEHPALFRLGIALSLLFCAGMTVVLAAYYVILRPYGRAVALTAAAGRVLLAATWAIGTAELFDTLRLLNGGGALRVFSTGQLQALAAQPPSAFWDHYYVALLFWGLSTMLFGYLWLRSRHISRAFAASGIVAGALALVPVAVHILAPDAPGVAALKLLDTPLAIFEVALSVRLLAWPLKPAEPEVK